MYRYTYPAGTQVGHLCPPSPLLLDCPEFWCAGSHTLTLLIPTPSPHSFLYFPHQDTLSVVYQGRRHTEHK